MNSNRFSGDGGSRTPPTSPSLAEYPIGFQETAPTERHHRSFA
jgi:hypothetical protein